MGYLRKRILLLWGCLILMLLFGILWWHGQEESRIQMMYEQTRARYTEAAEGILNLEGARLKTYVDDYSWWDDMVLFVKSHDKQWAKENIHEGMSAFGVDAVAVYDMHGKLVYSSGIDDHGEPPMQELGADEVRALFQYGPLCHFYADTPAGPWEIRGAEITYTADPGRELPAQGYFFAGRLWDSAYLSELEGLLRARVSVQRWDDVGRTEETSDGYRAIHVLKPLVGLDGKPLLRLCINKEFREGIEVQAATRKALVSAIGFAVVLIALLCFSLTILVIRPVRILTRAMESQSTESLSRLENPNTEFGRLATLIRQFFAQKSKLQEERDERARTADALRRSEELLVATLRSIGEGVISTDASGNVIGINQSAQALTGWSLQEAQGRPIEEILRIVKSGTHDMQENPVRETLAQGKAVGLANDTELIARDGTRRQIADSCSPILDLQGRILGAVLVFRDISEEYRQREKLLASEQRFAQIAERSGEIIWEVDKDGLFTYVSHACRTLLGYDEEEVAGKLHFYDLLPEQDRDDIRQQVFHIFDKKAHLENFQHKLVSKDGRLLDILTNGVPIVDDKGELIGYRGSDRDITEQLRAEHKLRETNDIINRSPMVVFLWKNEPGWPVEVVTENVKELCGYTARDFTSGKLNFAEVVHPEDLDRVGKEVAEYSSEQGRLGFVQDYRIVTKEGKVKWVEDRTSVRRDASGKITHYQGIVFDITARKSAEEELRVRSNFERVISNISSRFVGNEEETRAVNDSLRDVGELTGASRAYLFMMDSDGEHVSNTHEWCSDGVTPQIERLQCLPTQMFPWWMQTLEKGEIINISDVSAMPPEASAEREILEAQGNKSVLVLPLLVQGRLQGFIGLDNVHDTKDWPEQTQTLLEVCARTFATYLERKQAERELKRLNDDLHSALSQTQEYAAQADMARAEALQKAQVLDHQSTHDPLTDLPNRKAFQDELAGLIESHNGGSDTSFHVLFMDLDKFKLINDTMGHTTGDLLLVEVASRLRSCVRAKDFLARMGGDEFTAVVACGDRSSVESVANRVLDSISRPFVIKGNRFVVGVSIGIAAFPIDGSDVSSLMKHADAAMYKAKQSGRGTFRWYTGDVDADNQARMMLESNLLTALEEGQLKVYYQPIINLDNGTLQGAEALLRWEHPEKGMISPSIFIPLAEETGIIKPIGHWVLNEACRQMKEWLDEGMEIQQVGVNVSGVQMMEEAWVHDVECVLVESGLEPENLNIEITESEFTVAHEDVVQRLASLRKIGVSVAIDDFGIGQSSLGRLKDFPVIHLKIDGSFLRGIENSEHDKMMLLSIIEMAHSVGIRVTAEWVETEPQLAFLRVNGCDYAQGYAISKPINPREFRLFALERQKAGARARQAA